jgi:hypothetical protein
MTALLGWTILIGAFLLLSMLLLLPVFLLVRRRYPGFGRLPWAYTAATAGCSVALWYLIPFAIWEIFGRTHH